MHELQHHFLRSWIFLERLWRGFGWRLRGVCFGDLQCRRRHSAIRRYFRKFIHIWIFLSSVVNCNIKDSVTAVNTAACCGNRL